MNSSDRLFNIIWHQTLTAMVMMILSNIGAMLMDGIIAARVFGADASAAMGLISPYSMLVALIGGLIGTGCQTLCSGAMGKGDRGESDRTFATSFYFGCAVSLVLSAAVFAFARPICTFLGASGDNSGLLGETMAYLRGIAPGTVGMVLNIILSPVVQLYGGRKQVNRSVLVIFVADVVLDIVAVILNMGCLGIGLATSLSTYLGTAVMLRYALSGCMSMKLSLSGVDLTVLRPILKQGMPEAVKRFLRMGGDVFANCFVLMTATGAAMAGKNIGNMLASLLSTVGIGAASAMYLLSGVYAAMEDESGLLALGVRQVRHILITLLIAIVGIAFAPQLTGLMLKADVETINAAAVSVRCILAQMPVYICFEMVTYYMQSIGRGKEANVMCLLGSTVFYIPLILYMGKMLGAVGVLLAAPAALLLTLIIFYVRLCFKTGKIAALRDIMHISECINVSEIDIVAQRTLTNIGEAVECSESVRTALLEKGSDKRTAFACALFIEEICSNIMTHGQTRRTLLSKPSKFASVFVYIEKDIVTMRIADNCALFDPYSKLKSFEERQREADSGLGLKLIFSMAEEASYTSMLNMNHMLIRVPMHGGNIRSDIIPKTPEILSPKHPGA